ncbi:MAG: hypothetical protein ACFE9Z_04920 [Promethearchaeota archaeon]
MSKNRDALKFFHNYIREMIDIGGSNLPKSISASLGAKLGKLLKNRGISSLEGSLNKIYRVLNAKTKIKNLDENTLEVTLHYKSRFCPLGGKYNPERANLIQETLCVPYTVAILNSIHPEYKCKVNIDECILSSHNKACRYLLSKEFKNSKNNQE